MTNEDKNSVLPAQDDADIKTDNLDQNELPDNDIPTANEGGRDSSNNKKLQMMALIVVGVLVMLVGLGLGVGRYQEAKKAKKIAEAEKAAQQQEALH